MPERSGFRREVGLFMAVMIGIGAMMGPGIFALPSEVAGSAVVGRPIAEIEIPDACIVAAVIREREFVVPRGNTVIEADDRIVLVGPEAAVRAAHRTFGAVGTPA